jgi:predicted nucleic acid-binding protein
VRRLLKLLENRRGLGVISAVVLAEIDLASAADAAAIKRSIASLQPAVYPLTEAVEALARAYIAAGILPERRQSDALHVAVATYHQIDYLVSWNHRHMTRPMKRLQYEAVNRLEGYLKTPLICNPVEACDELGGE